MDDLKVSVIVPVYNVERYLDRCVGSIVGQTYKNLEIILVDEQKDFCRTKYKHLQMRKDLYFINFCK